MNLREVLQQLYDEYMNEDNEKSDEAAAHYTEMHEQIVAVLDGIVSDDLTAAELCETHAKLCGGNWPGCAQAHSYAAP